VATGVAIGDLDHAAIAEAAVEGLTPTDDVHITGPQRIRMTHRLVQRAVTRAVEEAVANA
jgi:CO/xanthine dehydrogenase FAD-binding subunit